MEAFMSVRRTALQVILAGLAAVVAMTVVAPAAPRAAAESVLAFTIEPGYDVMDDGLGEYRDFRIDPAGPADVNYCVEAAADNLVFIFLNRDLDALESAGTEKCGDDGQPQNSLRQFVLHIKSTDACDELMANDYGSSDGGPEGYCYLNGYRSPRMRLDKLYASRARSTPVDYLIGFNPDSPDFGAGGASYRVESDREAPITVSGSQRAVTYNGPFRLVKVGETIQKGKNAYVPPYAQPFNMTLRMTFTLETAAQ